MYCSYFCLAYIHILTSGPPLSTLWSNTCTRTTLNSCNREFTQVQVQPQPPPTLLFSSSLRPFILPLWLSLGLEVLYSLFFPRNRKPSSSPPPHPHLPLSYQKRILFLTEFVCVYSKWRYARYFRFCFGLQHATFYLSISRSLALSLN